ncbi:MAG: two-component sensor histidine kinase, partial [Pseudonocardia sediminis]
MVTARVAGRVRSLRARLVITVLLLFTLACVAIGVATSISLQHFLDGRQDREVAMSVDRFEKSGTGQLRPPP